MKAGKTISDLMGANLIVAALLWNVVANPFALGAWMIYRAAEN